MHPIPTDFPGFKAKETVFKFFIVPVHRAPWSVSAFVGAKVKSWVALPKPSRQRMGETTQKSPGSMFSWSFFRRAIKQHKKFFPPSCRPVTGIAWVTSAGASSGLSRSNSTMIVPLAKKWKVVSSATFNLLHDHSYWANTPNTSCKWASNVWSSRAFNWS